MVCEARAHVAHFVSDRLGTCGTFGFRIPDSIVERDIVSFLDVPVTTCALRDLSGQVCKNFDDAIDLFRGRLSEFEDPPLALAIKRHSFAYSDVSTVISVKSKAHEPPQVQVIREGAIDTKALQKSISDFVFSEFEDWT